MALPTFVGMSSVLAVDPTAITPALPASLAVDDILLLFLMTANQAITIPTPNGGTWTEVANSPQGTGTAAADNATRVTAFWSRYNGTQGNPTTSDSGGINMGRIYAFRGCITTGDPWDVTAGGASGVSDTSGSIPGATTTVADCLIVAAITTDGPDQSSTTNFGSWTNTDLANVTERSDNTHTTFTGGGLAVATGEKATAGAYGATAVTLATAGTKAMMSIALKPATGAGALVQGILDDLELTEISSRFLGFIRFRVDNINISETTSNFKGLVRFLLDQIDISETTARFLVLVRRILDQIEITESTTPHRGLLRNILDQIEISETTNRFKFIFQSIVDNLQITATVSRISGLFRVIVDNLEISTTRAKFIGFVRGVIDSVQISMATPIAIVAASGIGRLIQRGIKWYRHGS